MALGPVVGELSFRVIMRIARCVVLSNAYLAQGG